MITDDQQSIFKRCHSDKHFPEFLPTRWRQKSTGRLIDMEQITSLSPIGGGAGGGHRPPNDGRHHALWAPNSDTTGP